MLTIIIWPVTVLIIAIFALIVFKTQLARLIDRTTSVSKAGIIATGMPQESGTQPKASIVADFLKKTFDNALLVELEEVVTKQVDALNPTSETERSRLLLRLMAATTIARAFDLTYYHIFGSQIVALQYLNEARGITVPATDLKQFYDSAKNSDPAFYGEYAFEGWLSFLQSGVLVRRDGPNVAITVRGTEFLKYLVDQGYSLVRRG